MALIGKVLHCSAWTKEHLWTSVGLWVLHRKTEMKNRILLQIHVMLLFHLSPWEHKGVYTVLSGACDPVNNNSWTCGGWCQLLDRLLWQPESLLSKWSCAPCGWSTGHSGLQGKAAHGWSCVRGDLSVLWSLCSLHDKEWEGFSHLSNQIYVFTLSICPLDNPCAYRFWSSFRFGSTTTIGRQK